LNGTDRTLLPLEQNCFGIAAWTHSSNAVCEQLRSTLDWLRKRTIQRSLTNTRNWHASSANWHFIPTSMNQNPFGSELLLTGASAKNLEN
jgi:hypothetical protein